MNLSVLHTDSPFTEYAGMVEELARKGNSLLRFAAGKDLVKILEDRE